MGIEFSFEATDTGQTPDWCLQGFVRVAGDTMVHDSRDHAQPVWLDIALTDLLSEMLTFLTNPTQKQFVFESIYGDYRIKFEKNQKGSVVVSAIRDRYEIIGRTTVDGLRDAFWKATNDFLARSPFRSNEEVNREIESEMAKWRDAFPDLQPAAA